MTPAPATLAARHSLTHGVATGPLLVFLLGLGLATAAALWQNRQISAAAHTQFQHNVEAVAEHVQTSLQLPLYGLRGAKGVYVSSQKVTRAEFRAYVDSRDLQKEFAGVRGFGFIQRVPRPQLSAFLAATRADGAPQFALHQFADKTLDDLYIIKFIEPATQNANALGLDIGSDATRRYAAQRAVDSGEPTITAAITLVQDQRKTPGALMFVPVYANGTSPSTIAQRRASLVGLVYAPLVMAEVLDGLLNEREGLIDFELFDGPVQADGAPGGSLLYDKDGHTAPATDAAMPRPGGNPVRRFTRTQTITVAGRDMSLRVNSTARFDAAIDHTTPRLILVGGTLLGALLALLMRQQAGGRLKAEARAQEIASALRESELRWRFAIDGAGDGLWDWDVTQSTVFFSTQWKAMLGYAEDDIGNALDEWSKRVHPEDMAQTMADVTAHLDGISPSYVNEHRMLCKDGSFKWILDRGLVVQRDPAGKPLRVIGLHTDITQRKQVEVALRKSELAARTADEASQAHLDALRLQKFALDEHAIVAATDVQGTIIYVNDKFCKISGYTRAELIGQNHLIVNSGTHPHGFFKAMYRTVSAGKTWHGEICNKAKNGELYWVDTTIVPVMNRDGKPEQYLSIRSDITMRKQVELDLVQQQLTLELRVKQKTQAATLSEQHLRLVMNTSLDAIVGMDAQGHITEWSRQAEATFGWTQAEVKGKPLHDFIIPERYREAHKKGLARFLENGAGVVLGKRIEMSALRRDGNEFPVELAISPIVTPQGTSFSAFMSDVTERKQQQAALVTAKAAAEAASQAKSEFLAHMSHEIRTPMNGVVGMVDILRETPLLPEQQRMLETVQQSALALLDILNDILDFSKIEAGKLQVESIPTHIREVAQGAVQLVHAVSGGSAVRLSVFVAPALPQWFLCDPTRLRQVLLNLLGNAVKFSNLQGNGPARVGLHVEPCTLEDGAVGVRFCVRDNGIGMSAEVMQRLFQPFMQADESTARKFGGTGLGLSITQHLVELMGGRIAVRSTPGEGSEFTVDLSLQSCEPGRKLPALPSLTGIWVVMVLPGVNADADESAIVTAYAQAAGATVSTVSDLAAARSLLQQEPTRWADCVVLVPVDEASPTAALNLPTQVGVVRSILRGSDHFDADIRLATQPLLQGDLLTAIAQAKSRWVPQLGPGVPERRSKVRSTAPTVEDAVQAQQLILLAEDNPTNRKVMQQQLRLLGYTCEIAEDGAQALHLWQSQPERYALLLSDCHMPVLDGFGLTAAIRAAEAQSGAARLPIIAVTANAMQGEAQRCIERGMDDYLSKPLRMQELSALLTRWVPSAGAAAAPERPVQNTSGASQQPIWDPRTLRNLVGDDPDLLQDLLQEFLRNAQQQTADIVAGAATQDTAKLADAAHTLKSAARSVGALALGELCQSLETTGRAGDALQCAELAAGLVDALAAATREINGHLGRQPL